MSSSKANDDSSRLLQDSSRSSTSETSQSSTLINSARLSPPAHTQQRPNFASLSPVASEDEGQHENVINRFSQRGPGNTVTKISNQTGLGILPRIGINDRRILGRPFTRRSTGRALTAPSETNGTHTSTSSTFAAALREMGTFMPLQLDDPRTAPLMESSPLNEAATFSSTAEDLKKEPSTFTRSSDFSPSISCPSHKQIHVPRSHWLSVTLLGLSLFSTVFSGIYLAIAIRGPNYTIIHQQRSLSISTATLLIAFFAKLIELSFVTVFVAFIGQVISRRAFMTKHGRGITLAEISMRNWVTQPGSILTHYESVRYGLFSLLGVLAMCGASVALLYTSASAALVSPQLRFGGLAPHPMMGLVKASFANAQYVQETCQTPIMNDPVQGAATCLQMEHAAQSYYNYYETYIREWSAIALNGNGSSQLKQRIHGTGLLQENVTVAGAWIGDHDMAFESEVAGRTINNVTMAMPHAGVFNAAMDPINNILTPEGTEGLGSFSLHASVPSPAIHVLCVNISKEELRPMIYTTWPGAQPSFNPSAWPFQLADTAKWRNKTAVDDLFGWNDHGGGYVPPIFPRYPENYNTVLNDTVGAYGMHDAIYLLAKGGPEVSGLYNLCSIRGGLTPLCSTHLNVTSMGGTLKANCENANDPLQYTNSLPAALLGNATISLDYPYVAETWARALALGDGITDGDAANARLLTQMIPQAPELDPGLPSIAEALAVMAGCTLLLSSQGAPFLQFWNYSTTALEPGQYQNFNASIRSQQYASGGTFSYQRGFYLVLLLAFAFNVLVLAWFVTHNGLVTDFSEPPNLFALSINSPPSERFAGSCGGGPDREHYKVNWFVNVDGDHIFIEDGEKAAPARAARTQTFGQQTCSPIERMYSKLSKRKSLF